MPWYYYVAYFFAGAFLANSIPHSVQGICGNKFPTPFASPPGVGESSAVVNVLWGWFNFVVGAGLIRYFFAPLPPPPGLCIAAALGGLVIALFGANHFGKLRSDAAHS